MTGSCEGKKKTSLGGLCVQPNDAEDALADRGQAWSLIVTKRCISVLTGTCVIASAVAPPLFAQGDRNIPVIRSEARNVLVPTSIIAKHNGGDYDVLHLIAADFRLFEDGKEQKIEKVTLERVYRIFFRDNLGVQDGFALTPNAKWMSDWLFGTPINGYDYVIAYIPPLSPGGSCHQIKVKVQPKDASGKRLTTAEMGPVLGRDGIHNFTFEVDRRNLIVDTRTEYCNTEHSSLDPLYGTKVSRQMESVAISGKARESGLSLRAIDLYDESGAPRVQVALDFPRTGGQTGIPSFVIAVVGMTYRNSDSLASRFSDSVTAGCPFWDNDADPRICLESIPNHYETQIHLTPGEYDLRVVVSYGGDLRRAQVPVTVESLDGKHLAVSGIALCRRFHQYGEGPQNHPQSQTEHQSQTQTSIPTMPFELIPLVSKGIEFTPTGDTRFKKKEPLIAYFEVYEPVLAGAGRVNAQFQMRIIDVNTGELKTDTGSRPTDSFIRSESPVIPISQQIAINELSKGTYRLEVHASDSAGNLTDWRATSFIVE
jgi:hypothetical protein